MTDEYHEIDIAGAYAHFVRRKEICLRASFLWRIPSGCLGCWTQWSAQWVLKALGGAGQTTVVSRYSTPRRSNIQTE